MGISIEKSKASEFLQRAKRSPIKNFFNGVGDKIKETGSSIGKGINNAGKELVKLLTTISLIIWSPLKLGKSGRTALKSCLFQKQKLMPWKVASLLATTKTIC